MAVIITLFLHYMFPRQYREQPVGQISRATLPSAACVTAD